MRRWWVQDIAIATVAALLAVLIVVLVVPDFP